MQASKHLLSSREHWLDELKKLRQRSRPNMPPHFALHRRHLGPLLGYVGKLPASIGKRVSVDEHQIVGG